MDIVDKPTRSRMMANIKTKGTKPEMVVRRLLHGAGYRYRLHRKDLPGCPDLVLPKYRAVIFVHGCFWHLHQGCPIVKIPAANKEFWQDKLGKNRARDQQQILALNQLGWRVLVVWECVTRQKKSIDELKQQIFDWIDGTESLAELP
jgi:DNA mismatch endonuclease, patch repair protein